MKYFISVVLGLVLGAGAAFLAMHEAPAPPEPLPVRDPNLVARVGDLEVFVADVEAEMARRKSDDPAAVLEEMIERLAVVAKARAASMHEESSVKRKLENVLIGEIRARELDPLMQAATVNDEQVKGEYEANIERYKQGRKIRLAMLTKEFNEHWSESKRAALLAGLQELRRRAIEEPVTGKGFGALAIEGTEFQAARYKGGDVGWFTQGIPSRWPAAAVAAGFGLENIGDVSEIIESDGQLFVLKLMDVREAGVTPFDEVKAGLKHSLLIQAKKGAEREWWKAARSAVATEVFEGALERVKVPSVSGRVPVQGPPGLP